MAAAHPLAGHFVSDCICDSRLRDQRSILCKLACELDAFRSFQTACLGVHLSACNITRLSDTACHKRFPVALGQLVAYSCRETINNLACHLPVMFMWRPHLYSR